MSLHQNNQISSSIQEMEFQLKVLYLYFTCIQLACLPFIVLQKVANFRNAEDMDMEIQCIKGHTYCLSPAM